MSNRLFVIAQKFWEALPEKGGLRPADLLKASDGNYVDIQQLTQRGVLKQIAAPHLVGMGRRGRVPYLYCRGNPVVMVDNQVINLNAVTPPPETPEDKQNPKKGTPVISMTRGNALVLEEYQGKEPARYGLIYKGSVGDLVIVKILDEKQAQILMSPGPAGRNFALTLGSQIRGGLESAARAQKEEAARR